MDLTKSHHPNSIVLGSAKLEITKSPVTIDTAKKDWSLQQDLLDLGLARGVKISFESSKIDIKADNGTVPIKGLTDVKAKVEFGLIERHLPDIAVAMAGLVNVMPVFLKKEGSDVFFGKAVSGLEKDKENTIIPKDDYVKCKDKKIYAAGFRTNMNNLYSVPQEDFVFKVNAAGDLTVTCKTDKYLKQRIFFGYITSFKLTKGSGGVAQSIAMKLTNKRKADDGRIITRTFELPYGFYTGDDSITLKSKNDTDNIAEIPMSFEFTPHPDMVDDNELSEMSLYREIAEL